MSIRRQRNGKPNAEENTDRDTPNCGISGRFLAITGAENRPPEIENVDSERLSVC
jgi:hypothetical protein